MSGSEARTMDTVNKGRNAMRVAGLLLLVAMAGVAGPGCTPDFAEQGQAPVILRILKITASSEPAGEESDFLISDVEFEGSVFNDNAVIEMEVLPKNPNAVGLDTRLNDVLVERYEVRFIRSDGRDQEGVDVPFRHTGAVATVVPYDDTASAAVVVVRHQAKREAPLANIQGGGGANLLTVIAEITVHGRTTAGKGVSATGRLQILFADFVDTP